MHQHASNRVATLVLNLYIGIIRQLATFVDRLLRRNKLLSWNTYRFTMNDQNGKNTRLYLDLPIIDLVVRPIVESAASTPPLWRIHRRAENGKPDSHQLTLRAFVTNNSATRIEEAINSNALIAAPYAKELVNDFRWVEKDDRLSTARSSPKNTSDLNKWPEELQECWPQFAMGFSRSLLELLKSLRERKGKTIEGLVSGSGTDIIAFYEKINRDIMELWQEHGAGVFLHQTHAIFGYPAFEAFLRTSTTQGQELITEIHSPRHLR